MFSDASALLNVALVLALLSLHPFDQSVTFWLVLTFGVIYTTLAFTAPHKRRGAFIVLATIGSVLLIAAVPYRFSGSRLPVLWLAEAEALFLMGVSIREVIFRRIGLAALFLVAEHLLTEEVSTIVAARGAGIAVGKLSASSVFGLACAVLYLNGQYVARRWGSLFASEIDHGVVNALTYAGAALFVTGVWIAGPTAWVAVGWMAGGVVLGVAARWTDSIHLAR